MRGVVARGAAAIAVVVCLVPEAAAQGRRRQLPADKARNHESVLAAYAPVVERARRSTVRVWADGQAVAWGLAVDAQGGVATKRSEVMRARSLICELPDGRREPARLVAGDDAADLALLRIEGGAALEPVAWAEASPGVARFVATVGHGDAPAAVGVVSLPEYTPPAPRGGSNRRPARLGVRYKAGEGPAVLAALTPRGAAQRAGLAVGDVILDVDGIPVGSAQSVIDTLAQLYGGDEIEVAFRRGERESRARILLDAAPERRRFNRQQRLWGELSEVRGGFPRVIQHDTLLAPDQCGGALVTLDGAVVGMNIARVGRVESWALPASTVREVVARLAKQASADGADGG